MLALAQMRDDFNKSSFCETMSSAHACSAAMEDFLSSDTVADLAFGHCLRSHRLRQAKTDATVGSYCQRFQGVLSAAVKASDTIDRLRECYMMELEQKSHKSSTAQGVATKGTQIPQQVPAPQSQVQQLPAVQPQVRHCPSSSFLRSMHPQLLATTRTFSNALHSRAQTDAVATMLCQLLPANRTASIQLLVTSRTLSDAVHSSTNYRQQIVLLPMLYTLAQTVGDALYFWQ
ncbi:unnamed protein product [Symbiodinium sp. CCMP2592]|nr:unnamed protein product [Symbiodinium sp. CCMP2592]